MPASMPKTTLPKNITSNKTLHIFDNCCLCAPLRQTAAALSILIILLAHYVRGSVDLKTVIESRPLLLVVWSVFVVGIYYECVS